MWEGGDEKQLATGDHKQTPPSLSKNDSYLIFKFATKRLKTVPLWSKRQNLLLCLPLANLASIHYGTDVVELVEIT